MGSTSSVRAASSHAARTLGLRRVAVGDGEPRTPVGEGRAEPIHPLGGRPGCIGAQEGRVAERDLHVVEPAADERLQGHGVDVMRLDPIEQLVVQVHRLLAGEPEQDLAEALVLVAADELAMRLAEAAAAAELGAAGPLLERLPVQLDRGGPVALPLQVERPLQDVFGIAARSAGDGDVLRERRARASRPDRPYRRPRAGVLSGAMPIGGRTWSRIAVDPPTAERTGADRVGEETSRWVGRRGAAGRHDRRTSGGSQGQTQTVPRRPRPVPHTAPRVPFDGVAQSMAGATADRDGRPGHHRLRRSGTGKSLRSAPHSTPL